MSDQPEPGGGSAPAPPSSTPAAPNEESELEGYFRANRATVTEAALRHAAIEAGHDPAVVDATIAATRERPPGDRGVATRRVFIAYLAVWLVLDALMLINPANTSSGFIDARGAGILILSVALGAAFLVSLVWIGNRRLFGLLLGLGFIGYGAFAILPAIQYGASTLFPGLVAAVVGVVILAVTVRSPRTSSPSTTSMELLMVVPLLILLVIGGICVASGLPIPRPVG